MMIGRVSIQRLELVRLFDRSKLSNIERAIRRQFHAQHIVNAHHGNYRTIQLRMLGKRRAHQQPAVTTADDPQLRRLGILMRDHVSGARREIVEDILLLGQHALPVPVLAILSAAPQIGLRQHHAVLQQRHIRRGITGRNA